MIIKLIRENKKKEEKWLNDCERINEAADGISNLNILSNEFDR